MVCNALLEATVHARNGAKVLVDLFDALVEAGLELVHDGGVHGHCDGQLATFHVLEVFHREVQDVRLFQLGVTDGLHWKEIL